MMSQKMISQKSKNLLHAKVSEAITDMHEQQLIHDLDKLFSHVCKNVLTEIDKHWDNLLIKGQVDLILAPLHEAHKQYYNIIIKHKNETYKNSRSTGKRIVKNIKKNKTPLATYSDKSQNLLSKFTKGDYFGTLDYSEKLMQTRTFKASEKTLNRIDKDINNILAEGYHEGWGQNAVANKITKRFNQIKGWEAKRIARTEIHNAQNMGIMQGYQDMGVEYIQWNAAHDNRVRDTHIDLDGEIIPIGGVFSNGLMYPGDMLGSVEEVINCRCQALPYIIPDGYIAPPGMAQFREEDLIATLDYFNKDDLIKSLEYDNYITDDGKSNIWVKEVKNPNTFKDYLQKAVDSQSIEKGWRVDIPKNISRYDNCIMYVTEHGSTTAIDKHGDIISLCAKIPKGQKKSKDSSRALLEFATKNGGTKLDSYDGNYGFYRRCGFEPVSYCDFIEDFAPDAWKEGRKIKPNKFRKEKIIFFKHTGKQSGFIDAKTFYKNVDASKDYDAAEKIRDEVMK